MRTDIYSDSDQHDDEAPKVDGAYIHVDHVSLCFKKYAGTAPSLKQSVLNAIFRRSYSKTEEFWLYEDLSLHVEHGEHLGIIGANGSGKSTLLRMITGIYTPTCGRICVAGRIAPLIGLGAGINPELSGRENILLMGALLGSSPRVMAEKTEGILEFSGVAEFADTPLKYYSTGMLMRLAFSVATGVDPEVLLVDEVLAAGDAAFVHKAMRRMATLMDESDIVLLVSHNLGRIKEFASRVIWLDRGRIRADGDPAQVCDSYLAFQAAQAGGS